MQHTQAPTTIAVSVQTAARMLDMTPRTVLQLIQSKRLPAVRLGKEYRIKVSDIHVAVSVDTEVLG